MYNAMSVGKKTPKTTSSLWDFVTLPEVDPATAIGTCTEKLVKIMHVVPEISLQTDRHTTINVLITILCHHSRGRSNKLLTM